MIRSFYKRNQKNKQLQIAYTHTHTKNRPTETSNCDREREVQCKKLQEKSGLSKYLTRRNKENVNPRRWKWQGKKKAE